MKYIIMYPKNLNYQLISKARKERTQVTSVCLWPSLTSQRYNYLILSPLLEKGTGFESGAYIKAYKKVMLTSSLYYDSTTSFLFF